MRSRQARVLLLSENLPIARDHRLRKQAGALLAGGFAVTVVCRRDPGNMAVSGITLRDYRAPADARSALGYLWEYGWSLAMATWKVLGALLSEGFDALQVSSTPDIYFPLSLFVRALGKRVVFDARDLSPEIFTRRYGQRFGPLLGLLRVLERASYRSANEVLVVNESLARVARERCGVRPERVTLVGNGPVMGHRRPCRRDAARPAHLCCFVGLIGPQDGVHLALEAAAQLVHERGRSDLRFVFAGVGDALPAARELASRLRLDTVVRFPGWLRSGEVAELLAGADVGLEPNLEAFVSPVKAMEYMSFSLPVVAFDLRETRLTVGSGGLFAAAGDSAAFADCIELLLDDAAMRRQLGDLGYERVRDRLAWEHQQRRYVALYGSMLGARRHVGSRPAGPVQSKPATMNSSRARNMACHHEKGQ
jgi:glycosyltransferase involved in cell wall biosynthesis